MTKTRSIWVKSLLVGLFCLAGSLAFFTTAATVSVAIGIVLALANFWLLERLVAELLRKGKVKRQRIFFMFVAKLGLLLGLLGIVVLKLPIEAGPFLVGLSCVVGGIIISGVMGLFFGPADEGDVEEV